MYANTKLFPTSLLGVCYIVVGIIIQICLPNNFHRLMLLFNFPIYILNKKIKRKNKNQKRFIYIVDTIKFAFN